MTYRELILSLLRRVTAIVASLGSAAPVRPDGRGRAAPAARFPTAVPVGRKVMVRVVALTNSPSPRPSVRRPRTELLGQVSCRRDGDLL